MKKLIAAGIVLAMLNSSCSRKIYFRFDKEEIEAVPDNTVGFYNNIKTVHIKTTNQVVLGANDMSSNLGVLVNMMERAFQKNNYEISNNNANADLVVEFVALHKDCQYTTNTAYKYNNDKQKIYNCDFSFCGYRIYVKLTNKINKIVNYTFFQTPCTEDNSCVYVIDKECNLLLPHQKIDKKDKNKSYTTTAKDFPLKLEIVGNVISGFIINEIKSGK